MNTVKYKHVAIRYTNRKVENMHNIKENYSKYEYIIALNINQISAHIQYDLRNKLHNNGHLPFKIVNKIAIKIFNLSSLEQTIKGQILYIGTNNLNNAMKICNMFTNIKPIIGIHKNEIMAKDILIISGQFNRIQLIALVFKTLENERFSNIINIFELLNQ